VIDGVFVRNLRAGPADDESMSAPRVEDNADLVPWIDAPWPLDWPALFGRQAPLVLEIGFGTGGFLAHLAQQRADCDCVGIEIAPSYARRMSRRLGRDPRSNVRLLCGDAHLLLERLFSPHSIDTVYINFPDPWYKNQHHDRRLVQPAFIELLSRRMALGGTLHLATDHAGLAAWVAKVLGAQDRFASVHDSPAVARTAGQPATYYEQKALVAGSTIHSFEWRHVRPAPDDDAQDQRVAEMPNVSLQGPFDVAAFFASFQPPAVREPHRGEAVIIAYSHVFKSLDETLWLVETTVTEGRLQQSFAVLVVCREDGRLTIKTSRLGAPRPTFGAKRAVWWMARQLLRSAPTATVVESTVGEIERQPRERE
jgi:tRNA (guanine-N7-)-methyltransferase